MLFLEAFQHSNIQYSLMAPLTPISSNCIKVQDLHAAQHDSDGRTGAGPSFPENDVLCFFCFWHLKFVLYGMFLVFLCLGWTKERCMRWIDFAHSNMRSSKCNQDCTNQIRSVLRLVRTFLLRVKTSEIVWMRICRVAPGISSSSRERHQVAGWREHLKKTLPWHAVSAILLTKSR